MRRNIHITKAHILKLGKIHLFALLLLIAIIGLAGHYATVYQAKNTSPSVESAPPVLPHTTYNSPSLGVTFTYIPLFPNGIGQYYFVKEISNKIYLYTVAGVNHPFDGTDNQFLTQIAPSSKYIEILIKNPDLSLMDAVKQQILTGYSASDCTVKPTHHGDARQNKTYQTAVISANIPHTPNLSYADMRALVAKCPSYVDQNAGISYFLMDPNHPDKMLFVQIGQDNVPSGLDGYSWDGTITIQ